MASTDAMVAKLQREFDDRNTLIEQLTTAAVEQERDLRADEMDNIKHARERMDAITTQMVPLRDAARVSAESRARNREMSEAIDAARRGERVAGDVNYRSAGEYIADVYLSSLGSDEARTRLDIYQRTAAHQTTTDNPGLLPEQIVEPVINLMDDSRPLVSAVGTTDLGTGSWAYAKVTQHTQVGVQSAEKAEMASRKMTITKTSITAPTYGGYVNVSKQDINRTSPQILDMVIGDLASQYAIETEAATCTALLAGATAGTALDATPSGDEVAAALWAAAATAYSNVKGGGRLIIAVAPSDLAKFGPIFQPVNPSNSQSTGFSAGSFGSGAMGAISGMAVVMTPGLAGGQALVINTAAVRLFEAKYGALQVNEPSVWGVQVGYAGDFQPVIVQTGAIVSIDTVP